MVTFWLAPITMASYPQPILQTICFRSVNLPLSGSQNEIAQIPASNSVVGAPYALALSPDGHAAFVVETLGATPAGATHREQLPSGQQLVATLG